MPPGNCALLSPTCLFKKHIVATAGMWWVELAGLGAKEENLACIDFLAASDYNVNFPDMLLQIDLFPNVV